LILSAEKSTLALTEPVFSNFVFNSAISVIYSYLTLS
jgi:hypothetical protein